jgi:putative transposase
MRNVEALYLTPFTRRGQVCGYAYHVLNRGNSKAAIFHQDGDDLAFIELLAAAKKQFPVNVFGLCLMPNYSHLIVIAQPATETTLGPFMQWWMICYVRRDHQRHRSTGHV